MKLIVAFLFLATSEAFAPVARSFVSRRAPSTSLSFGVDPSQFHDLSHHLGSLQDLQDAIASTTMSLADAEFADLAADAAEEVATDSNGWFGFLTGPISSFLQLIHSSLVAVGVNANAWGVSIIFLTVLIKVATFPLTKQQLESTNKMQAMSPAIKEIQAKYQSNPEVMNQKVAEFYQVNEINPLAGCIPSLVQIPVFIGLYRAVLELAKENKLDESFLFLPNLEGPTYGADPAHGTDWLLQGWTDGVPSLGWDSTISFLILPVFLVISQYVSMELMQPKTDDPAQQSSNAILKVLPIMIGWFALNVPAALSVYWVVNNIVTTATSVIVRNSIKTEPLKAGGDAGAVTLEPPATIFAPPREKPSGFSAPAPSPISSDDVKPITVIDAEVVEGDASDDGASESAPASKRRKKKKGKKRNN